MFTDAVDGLHERLNPYIISTDLDEPIVLLKGPFKLVGSISGTLASDLSFRWSPSIAVEFDGLFSEPHPVLDDARWYLEGISGDEFRVEVLTTGVSIGVDGCRVRGVLNKPLSLGTERFECLQFTLANFPDYAGDPVRYSSNGSLGFSRARLRLACDAAECLVDSIAEVRKLRETASRDAGFFISHVGEWRPKSGSMTAADASDVLRMLHFWFGFLRGAWTGPLLPRGVVGGVPKWRQFAPSKLRESREVRSWLPTSSPLNLDELFVGFCARWADNAWRSALITSIAWLVEANAPSAALESRIVLGQVAIDLLAWVHLVETRRMHSRSDFRRLSAAGRIRALFHDIGVPTNVPEYLEHLPELCRGDSYDGPGVITRIRNALVHATEDNRLAVESLKRPQLLECSQLVLHYLELCLLAVCGYHGRYARRGWRRGWEGDAETEVPWMKSQI